MTSTHDRIPLQILLCDPDEGAARIAQQAFSASGSVINVASASSIPIAQTMLRTNEINTIIVDPLAFALDEASDFVFGVRKTLPEIVFVLYMNKNEAERRRSEFYRGERTRFAHYYTLDKETPIDSFADEVKAVVQLCQVDLSWRLSKESLQRLLAKAGRLIATNQGLDVSSLEEFRDILAQMPATVRAQATLAPKTVFLSHRFAEQEYVGGLTALLEKTGFTVATGRSASSFIGKAVLNSIRESEYFLCLMTRADQKADGTYTTSSWLFQELGAAIAFGKQLVLMVEDGVTDLGGLQGDWQRIHFGAKGFLTAALEAVEQLKSYAGEA